ncbi:CHAT domain-containing tetratricopeptide repeat protein [Aquimarina litoralis]|uniref:CHAT domain-containing protein n=1 Tax=Aquimarina litoralis TaxID=584605 RepID=UPI0031E36E06
MNKINVRVLRIILFFLPIVTFGQGISSILDSIHQLPGTDFSKLTIYSVHLEEYKKANNYSQLGYDAHQLAKWIHKEKKWDKAIELVKVAYEARAIASPYNVKLHKASCYNYANYHRRKGNLHVGIKYFKKMLALGGANFLKGRALAHIGDSYDILGDYHKAIEYQNQSFEYFNPEKHLKYIIRTHNRIGVSYRNIRSKASAEKSIHHFLIADSIIAQSKLPFKIDQYSIYNNLGTIYIEVVDLKDISKGINYLKKALEIAKEEDFTSKLSRIYFNLAIAYIEVNKTISSEYFDKALQYSKHLPSLVPSIYFGLGIKDIDEQQFLKAQENFAIAFSYHFGIDKPDIYWLPKKDLMKNIVNKAYFLQVLKEKLNTWILLAKKENNPSYFHEAIKTAFTCDVLVDLLLKEEISNNSKLLWRNLASEIYVMVLEACYGLNKTDDAFYFMEKGKALLLTQQIISKNNTIPDELLDKENNIKNNITTLQTKLITTAANKKDSIASIIFSEKLRLESFTDSLSLIYPKYFSSKYLPSIIALSELKLLDNEVAVEYIMEKHVDGADFEAYGLLISHNDVKLFKINNLKQLEKNIYSLRKQLNKPFTTEEEILYYKKVSYSIYQSLFPKEIQSFLRNKKITICSDYILNHIPFEGLITDLTKDTYFIEEAEINYVYSFSFMKENALVQREASKDLLGIAPVHFNNEQTTLSKSLEEISAAHSYYSGDILSEKEATKDNFLKTLDQYKIIHLATHANASDSLNPWIAFRNDKLYHQELGTVKNNADLVVLSACNTSLGKISRGEGIMSLARGFFRSGANTVIPSLWSTNDKATVTITADFYKNLSEGQTKSEALRTAKLNYLHNNTDAEASPHYWASMILIGDTGTLLPQSNNLWMFLLAFGIVIIIIFYFFLKKSKNS